MWLADHTAHSALKRDGWVKETSYLSFLVYAFLVRMFGKYQFLQPRTKVGVRRPLIIVDGRTRRLVFIKMREEVQQTPVVRCMGAIRFNLGR